MKLGTQSAEFTYSTSFFASQISETIVTEGFCFVKLALIFGFLLHNFDNYLLQEMTVRFEHM